MKAKSMHPISSQLPLNRTTILIHSIRLKAMQLNKVQKRIWDDMLFPPKILLEIIQPKLNKSFVDLDKLYGHRALKLEQ